MIDLSRRALFSGGLKAALGAGGLILPFAGGSALAMVDKRATDDVAVTPVEWPVSETLLRFRAIRDQLLALRRPEGGSIDYQARWILLWHDLVDAADGVWSEPVHTWGDVAARAEIAWAGAPKVADARGVTEDPGPYRNYCSLAKGNGIHYPIMGYTSAFSIKANAELIEAVLVLTGGDRVDPRDKPLSIAA